jgi:hypothetical protein
MKEQRSREREREREKNLTAHLLHCATLIIAGTTKYRITISTSSVLLPRIPVFNFLLHNDVASFYAWPDVPRLFRWTSCRTTLHSARKQSFGVARRRRKRPPGDPPRITGSRVFQPRGMNREGRGSELGLGGRQFFCDRPKTPKTGRTQAAK